MTSFVIKCIALVAMLLDHIGWYFFPELEMLRIVGRISFPLFCWLIAEGVFNTRSPFAYGVRLLLAAIFSQYPYSLAVAAVGADPTVPNVIFTLFMGFLAAAPARYRIAPALQYVVAVGLGYLAELTRAEYGFYGVALIFLFALFHERRALQIAAHFILAVVMVVWHLIIEPTQFVFLNWGPLFSVAGTLLILGYSGKRGWGGKYLFYAFYPLHLLVFWWLRVFAGW